MLDWIGWMDSSSYSSHLRERGSIWRIVNVGKELLLGRYVISVIINLICVFILQSNEHAKERGREKLAHESDAPARLHCHYSTPIHIIVYCYSQHEAALNEESKEKPPNSVVDSTSNFILFNPILVWFNSIEKKTEWPIEGNTKTFFLSFPFLNLYGIPNNDNNKQLLNCNLCKEL